MVNLNLVMKLERCNVHQFKDVSVFNQNQRTQLVHYRSIVVHWLEHLTSKQKGMSLMISI